MTDSERIAELERRVAELEGERRYYTVPIPQPVPTWPLPFVPLDIGWPLSEGPTCFLNPRANATGSAINSRYTTNSVTFQQ